MSNVTMNSAKGIENFIDSCDSTATRAEMDEAHVSVDEHGKLQHEFDLSGYTGEERAAIESALERIAGELEHLEIRMQKLADAGRGRECADLQEDYLKTMAQLADFKEKVEAGTVNFDDMSSEPLYVDPAASAAVGTTADEPDASVAFDWDEPAAMLAEFEKDPKAFFQKLQGVDSDERAAIVMTVQTELQKNNQLMSTITNFQKAQHDTQKAVISNIRV